MDWILKALMATLVACFAVYVYATVQISKAREFCFARGNEYATAYVGGKVACIETVNGMRTVVIHRRK